MQLFENRIRRPARRKCRFENNLWPEILRLSRTRTAVGFIEWSAAEANFVDDGLMISKTPATVITGFPGAGKTTMIRHILKNAEGHRIALVQNEIGLAWKYSGIYDRICREATHDHCGTEKRNQKLSCTSSAARHQAI